MRTRVTAALILAGLLELTVAVLMAFDRHSVA
jgi:hypothetical protein